MRFFVLVFLLLTLSVPVLAQDVEADAAYKNADLSVEERVNDLLGRMTLEEKIGQMTQVEKNSIKEGDITAYDIGSILSGGGGYPRPNTPEAWADMTDAFQQEALDTRLGIPLIYGADGVHGHNNVEGAVIFPHNIGLGATQDADLVEKICNVTAEEMAATGVYWNFAPVVAVPQDIRWGRTYEGYGENTELVTSLGTACVRGMQTGSPWVLATPKHFIGDGDTAADSSTISGYSLDQGVTRADEAELRALFLPPYQAALDAGALSVMASFSSWGGMKMSAQTYLLTDVLKGEMAFKGFVVSDWGAVDQISGNYYNDVVSAINAGIDMNMVPYDYVKFIEALKRAVDSGDVSQERIDDAVKRILTVKFELGLFEHPMSERDWLEQVGSDEHRALAREAVSKSLVLLKNDNAALPLAKDAATVFVGGEAGANIGLQSGGWTIEWQGVTDDQTPGTTIFDAVKEAVSENTEVKFDRFGRFKNANDASGNPIVADIGIAVVGERPYAEGKGDASDLALTDADFNLIERMRERSKILIVILISGRPMIITEELEIADAFVAAWLPGTEAEGITDVLFGDQPFTGKLPYTWPRAMDQLPFDFSNLPTEGDAAPLFPYGYGLTTG